MHALLTLPQENYDEVVSALASRARDPKMLLALQSLQQILQEVLSQSSDLQSENTTNVTLLSVEPPLDTIHPYLPSDKYEQLAADVLTGSQILDQLLEWRQDDAILASRLEPFFVQIEADAQALRAGEPLPLPQLKGERNPRMPELVNYEVEKGASVYWAHELLLRQGESRFSAMKAFVTDVSPIDDG